VMLPHVIRFNGEKHSDWYRELVEAIADQVPGLTRNSTTEDLANFVTMLVDRAGLMGRLSACGVDPVQLPELASDAAKQWTGTFNPRNVDAKTLHELYERAF